MVDSVSFTPERYVTPSTVVDSGSASGYTVNVSNPRFKRGAKLFAKSVSQMWKESQTG